MGHLQTSTDPLAGVVLKVLELMFQLPSTSYWVDVKKQNYSWYSLQGHSCTPYSTKGAQ